LRDIHVGAKSSFASGFTRVGSTIYFVADDDVHGPELWKTDGTLAGTKLVSDIMPGSDVNGPLGSNVSQLTAVGTSLYFTADDGGIHGWELWRLADAG
jgi:ELWxxDGT repeat protein